MELRDLLHHGEAQAGAAVFLPAGVGLPEALPHLVQILRRDADAVVLHPEDGFFLLLFQQQGYDAVTINAICAASGISKNTFYYYYSEKKDLLVSLFDASKETAHGMMYAIAGISSPYEKLRYIISGTLDYILYLGWAVVRKALELQLAGTKEMGGHGKPSEFGMLILNLFEQAQNAGEIRSDVPASDLMHTSGFLILGAVQIWAVNDGSLELK